MLWVIDRNLPNKAYLLLAAHPVIMILNPIIPNKTMMNIPLRGKLVHGKIKGIADQKIISNIRLIAGIKENSKKLSWKGLIADLSMSLTPSRTGWKRPQKEILLGPRRRWETPM